MGLHCELWRTQEGGWPEVNKTQMSRAPVSAHVWPALEDTESRGRKELRWVLLACLPSSGFSVPGFGVSCGRSVLEYYSEVSTLPVDSLSYCLVTNERACIWYLLCASRGG